MRIYRVRLRVEHGIALVAYLDALVAFRTGSALKCLADRFRGLLVDVRIAPPLAIRSASARACKKPSWDGPGIGHAEWFVGRVLIIQALHLDLHPNARVLWRPACAPCRGHSAARCWHRRW